jgi:hypothetical protein
MHFTLEQSAEEPLPPALGLSGPLGLPELPELPELLELPGVLGVEGFDRG